MSLLVVLLALNAVATAAGGVLLWRWCARLQADVRNLRSALDPGAEVPIARPSPAQRADALTADGWWGFGMALAAVAPALGFALGAPVSLVAATGVTIGAVMLAASFRTEAQRAVWPGTLVAAVWAITGVALGEGAIPLAAALAATSCVGVLHATLRASSAGQAGAALMAAAALALGAQGGMLSPAGAAFALIVLCAAVAGAVRLELEAMHLAAFGAALIGLLVLSGQDIAALWFTPAAALTGGAFFAIAAVRVPQLGERGVTLAGTGALAPLMATASLHMSQHGLADRLSAVGAFVALALLFGWLLWTAATRAERGTAALRLTLWVLAFAIFAALIAAVAIAAHAPLAASLTSSGSLFLVLIARQHKVQILQFFACAAAGLTLVFALWSAQHVLSGVNRWPGYATLAAGAALPAIAIGAAALQAQRAKLAAASAALEACAIVLGVVTLSLGLRLLAAQGAPVLHPVNFAEAGAHIALWLASAFLLRRRARKGARTIRIVAAHALTYTSAAASVVSGLLWLTPFWTDKSALLPLLSWSGLGFTLPAAGFFAHWALWRWRDIPFMARLCFGMGTALAATLATTEISRLDSSGNGLPSIVAALLLFAGAAALNLLPAIVRRRPERSRPQVAPIPARKAA